MARRNLSGKRHSRKFGRARRRSKKINNPTHIMRGGFRL